jgi:hypothetical protein
MTSIALGEDGLQRSDRYISAPTRGRTRLSNSLTLFAIGLIGVQPAGRNGAVVAPSDVLILLAILSHPGGLPRLPKAFRAAIFVLGTGLALSLLWTAAFGSRFALQWGMVRFLGFLLLIAYCAQTFRVSKSWSSAQRRTALRVLVITTLVANLLVAPSSPLSTVATVYLPQKFPSRLSGGLFDPNANAVLLAVCLLVTVASRDHLFRNWAARSGIAALLGVLLIATYSRGAFVALLAGALMIGCSLLRRRPHLFVAAASAAILGLSIASSLGAFDQSLEHFEARPSSSVTNRMFYVEDALDQGLSSPVTGGGLGASTDRNGAVVHATFFWILGDAGLITATAFLAFAALTVKLALNLLRHGWQGIAASLIAMLVASFSFEALYQRHWWVVLAIGASLTYQGQLEKQQARLPTRRA